MSSVVGAATAVMFTRTMEAVYALSNKPINLLPMLCPFVMTSFQAPFCCSDTVKPEMSCPDAWSSLRTIRSICLPAGIGTSMVVPLVAMVVLAAEAAGDP